MHKLRKFFYDNKNKIIKIGAFIIFLFIILQLLNKLAQIKNKESIENVAASNTTNANNITQNDNKGLISNKSAVNGSEVSKENLKNATDTIYKFVDYCNKQEIEKAYNLITEECKQQMYPTLDAFKNAYYGDVFKGKQRTCTIENWVGDIYKVRMGEDILSTGKDTGYAKEDYITIKKVDNEYKLNINNYIGTTKIEKTTTKDNITMEVLNKNTYKDFEEYTIKVTNNGEQELKNIEIADKIPEQTTFVSIDDAQNSGTTILENDTVIGLKWIVTVPAKESIEVIKVLKKYKTNISDMKYMWNIEDLIEDKTEKERIEIINELKKILGENAAKWPIGERLGTQKSKNNIEKFKEELEKAMEEGLELTNEEINKLTKKQTKSKNPIKDMIEVVKVLKHNDINISNIKVNGIIKDLFVGKTQEELIKIISELENVIGENVEEWPIGRQISNLKRKDSIEIFKEELEKVKKEENINFMLPEMKVLTTIQNKARDLLEVLKVLKKYEVHIDEIQTRGRTINELIEKNKDKEKILEELGKIITDQEDIGEWDVGTHLGTQKRKNNIKSFQEELEVAMNEGLELTDKEIHNLLDLNRGKDTSRSDEVIKFMKQIVFEQKQNRITWRKL